MAKTKISEFNSNPALNTDIDSINIAEGCAPSGINDAIRELMSQLKDFQTGAQGDSFNGPVGTTTAAAGAFTTLSATGNVTLGDASTDTLNVGNGGLIKDASGNLGLGVTPSAWGSNWKSLDMAYATTVATNDSGTAAFGSNWRNDGTNYIYKSGGYAGMYLSSSATSSVHRWFTAASGTAGNAITFTQAMTLDASGNLGVGTTSPASKLHVVGNTRITADIESTGNSVIYSSNGSAAGTINSGIYLVGSDSSSRFYTGNSERARIDSSGNLLVGTTSSSAPNPGFLVLPNYSTIGGIAKIGHSNGAASGTTFLEFLYNGSYIGGVTQNGTTGVLYNLTSDYRLKNNPTDLTGSGEFIDALQPKTWDWNDGSGKGVGFIAHEFMEVAKYSGNGEKDAVDSDGNPIYQSIQPSSSEVMAYLVAEVQSLRKRLADAGL